MKHNPKPNEKDVPWPIASPVVKGALSLHFCCFPARTFRRVIHGTFLVCLRDGYKNFEKVRLNLKNAIHLLPCHPQQQIVVNSLSGVI